MTASPIPSDVRRTQAVIDAMAALGDLNELSVRDALDRLEHAHADIGAALNPEAQPPLPAEAQ